MTYNFNLVNYVYRKLHWKLKKINQITIYFVEEGPGRGSEDIKKECNINCSNFFSFSVFLMGVTSGKLQST